MNPQPEPDVIVNRKILRELLVKSFSYEELQDLCFDYFPDVYDKLQEKSFGKNVAARLLIDYCERRGFLKHLTTLIQTHNAYQYSLHEAQLFTPNTLPAPSCEPSRVTLKLTFPRLKIENFTVERQAVLLQLIAEELNIPEEEIDIIDVREGSVILEVRLPSAAARRLIVLFYSSPPFIEDVGLGGVERVPADLSLWQRLRRFLSKLAGNTNVWLVLIIATTVLVGLAVLPLTDSQGQDLVSRPGWLLIPPTAETKPTSTVPAPTDTPSPIFSPTATADQPTPEQPVTVVALTALPEATTASSTTTPAPTSIPSPTAPSTATPRPTPTNMPTATSVPDERNLLRVMGPDWVAADQQFTVVVRIEEIVPPGVFGAQFRLMYPPENLEIVRVAPRPGLFVLKDMVDPRQGQLEFVASRYADVSNFSEPVDFVTITFRATTVSEDEVIIDLAEVKLGAKGGIAVSATVEPLLLRVEAEAQD